jgi:hypothetical protein
MVVWAASRVQDVDLVMPRAGGGAQFFVASSVGFTGALDALFA